MTFISPSATSNHAYNDFSIRAYNSPFGLATNNHGLATSDVSSPHNIPTAIPAHHEASRIPKLHHTQNPLSPNTNATSPLNPSRTNNLDQHPSTQTPFFHISELQADNKHIQLQSLPKTIHLLNKALKEKELHQ